MLTGVRLFVIGVFIMGLTGSADAADRPDVARSVTETFADLKRHDFHPVNEKSFTVDRHLGHDGISDLEDTDWRLRLRAVRDLVRAGAPAVPEIARGLRSGDVQVRYAAAVALGILRAEDAVAPLRRVVREDEAALVRSAAVVSLGQIESRESLDLLQQVRQGDPSRDVQHQAALSIDQIEKEMGATDALRAAYRGLDLSVFERLTPGAAAAEFTLPDTEGKAWTLSDLRGANDWLVLIWVFADWCPVCHGEFDELMTLREAFAQANVSVATVEMHDRYRSRVMVGKEIEPDYWFADQPFYETYTKRIWWPHLLDRGGQVGMTYGVDPMAYAVHAEYINRPASIIIGPDGRVRFAYYGTYWGDRPSIEQLLEMIREQTFDFEHPKRLKPTLE